MSIFSEVKALIMYSCVYVAVEMVWDQGSCCYQRSILSEYVCHDYNADARLSLSEAGGQDISLSR